MFKTDADCGDPMWNEPKNGPRTLKTDRFLKECEAGMTICRKIDQTGNQTSPKRISFFRPIL